MRPLLRSEELERRARELGVDIQGDLQFQSSSGRNPRAPDYELQRRISEAERSNRESMLWILAVISAIASVVSAIVALVAVAR